MMSRKGNSSRSLRPLERVSSNGRTGCERQQSWPMPPCREPVRHETHHLSSLQTKLCLAIHDIGNATPLVVGHGEAGRVLALVAFD